MGSSKAPKQPDPLPAAKATAEANKEVAQYTTALDRPTQSDPYGAITWEFTGAGGGTRDKPMPGDWVQRTTLSPQQQALLDLDVGSQQAAYGLGLDALKAAQVGGAGGQFDLSGLQNIQGVTAPNLNQFLLPQFQQGTQVVPQFDKGQGVPQWAGMSQFGDVPGATSQGQGEAFFNDPNAFAAQGQQVRDALYQQMTQFSDPRFAREEAALQNQLINQGLTPGSQAFNDQMTEFRRSKDESYKGAELASILAGGSEQSRLFGDLLASRQQRESELSNLYGQQLGQRQQQFGESQYGQNAALQAYQADMVNRGMGFDAGVTSYGLDEQSRQIAQQNAMQEYQAQLAREQQGFANQYQLANWDQNLRNQQIQEQSLQRQTPLNEALALAGMTGVTNPAFQPFNLSQPWQGVDYLGVQNQRYQGDVNQANFQNAQRSQNMQLLGTAGTAAATMMM